MDVNGFDTNKMVQGEPPFDTRSERERELEEENEQLREVNAQWFSLVMEIGKHVGCWASSFPDANGHILAKLPPELEQVAYMTKRGAVYGGIATDGVTPLYRLKTPNGPLQGRGACAESPASGGSATGGE